MCMRHRVTGAGQGRRDRAHRQSTGSLVHVRTQGQKLACACSRAGLFVRAWETAMIACPYLPQSIATAFPCLPLLASATAPACPACPEPPPLALLKGGAGAGFLKHPKTNIENLKKTCCSHCCAGVFLFGAF
jgi:hypothetical protein